MPPTDHCADDCQPCPACADYITWLEGQVLTITQSYRNLVGVLRAQAELGTTSEQLAELYGQSCEVIQGRRLHQIERHLSEGDDPSP